MLLLATSSHAQTSVSGAIAVDTHWTVGNSPYLINGNVVVQNGALLTVDPGVTIFMTASSGLTVQAGGISAFGTATNPIKVLSDKTRLGQGAAPGDWQQWVFNPGTVNTRLDYVVFENGNGIRINGCAPILNYLSLNNHQGPAISIDLAASPTGVGNQASGNTINGIVVPAGDITANVRWGLRGIPYVVTSGTVSVGMSPSVTTVTPNLLPQGQTAIVNIAGTRLSGLTSARFVQSGLTAQVLSGGSDTQARLSVTVDSSAVGGNAELRLLVDAGEIRVANAITVVQSKPTLVGLSPSNLYIGQGATDVTITGSNFASQSTVMINGAAVLTQALSATQLIASIPSQSATGNLLVRVRIPDPINTGQFLLSNELILPVSAAQFVVSPSSLSMVNGAIRTFSVSLPYVAPAGGAVVNLVSSVPTVATVPATLTIAAGQSSANFDLAATGLGSTVITASKVGFISGQAQVTVISPPVLTISPAAVTLGVGRSASITIQSSVVASASGLTINLSSSDASVATVPLIATIPAGGNSTTVSVTTVAIGTTTITAQGTEFVSGQTTVTVRPVSLNLPAGALVVPGVTRSVPIVLSDPAPAGGLLISLTSGNPSVATVPTSITVAEGQSSSDIALTGVVAGTTSISATASGYLAAVMPLTVDVVTIAIGNSVNGAISVPVDVSSTFPIILSRPAPAGGVVVNLSIADPTKAMVSPQSVTIPAGQTSSGAFLLNVTGVAKGTTTLIASALGLNTTNAQVQVTGKPTLAFNSSTVTVGKGLNTYVQEVYVSTLTDGLPYFPEKGLIVNLSSSDSSKASVPVSVTIPPGSFFSYFYVTGIDFTNSTPVTVDAAAPGHSTPTSKLVVNTIAPVLLFDRLDIVRSPANARDDFRFVVTTPGSASSGFQTAVADLPINVSLVEANPSNIVDGIYAASTGGAAVTQVLLSKGATSSNVVYVGTPATTGTYKVQATVPGVVIATSPLVTVSPPELVISNLSTLFFNGTATVGKGLKTSITNELYVYRATGGQLFFGTDALTVNLTSSDPTKVAVPVSVTIPAGNYAATFNIAGVDFTNGTPVTVDASALGYTPPVAKLAVSVVAPSIDFNGLDLNRSPLSTRDDFRIAISVPGAGRPQTAVSNLPINLSIVESNPTGVVDGIFDAVTGGVPVSQVTVAADTSFSNTVYVGAPAVAGSYKVQANAAGVAVATSGPVTVSAPELRFSTNSIAVGKGLKTYAQEFYVYRAANGQAFNGTQALTVNLISSDPSKATVPPSVTIPAGASLAYFTVTGVDFSSNAPVTVDAAASGYNSPTTKLAIDVIAPVLNFSLLDLDRATASARDDFYVSISVPGAVFAQTPAVDLTIDISIVGGAPTGIVSGFFTAISGGTTVTQLLIRAGTTSSDVMYVGIPTAVGGYSVLASVPGVTSATSDLVTVSVPELTFYPDYVFVGKGLATTPFAVSISRTVNARAFVGATAVTINLSCNSVAVCTVPSSVTIPAGQATAYFVVKGVDVGDTTVTASAVGYFTVQDLGVSVIP